MFSKIATSADPASFSLPMIIEDKGEYYIKLSDIKDTLEKDIETHLDAYFNVLADRLCGYIDKRLTKLSDQTANSFTYISKFIESHGDVFVTDYSNADLNDDDNEDWLSTVVAMASDIRKHQPSVYPRVKSVYNSIIQDMWRDYGFVREELRDKYAAQYDTDNIPSYLELIAEDKLWSQIFMNLLSDLHSDLLED